MLGLFASGEGREAMFIVTTLVLVAVLLRSLQVDLKNKELSAMAGLGLGPAGGLMKIAVLLVLAGVAGYLLSALNGKAGQGNAPRE